MSISEGIPQAESYDAHDAMTAVLLQEVHSVEDVLQNFEYVRPLLEQVGLKHIEPFWEIYGDVSATVQQGLLVDRFNRPDDVRHTLPIFYNQARHALLAHVLDQPKIMSPEWRRTLYDENVINAKPGIQFLMHMNAHINSDLAQALVMSGVHEDYKADFTLMVGKMLEEVATKHALQYTELRSPLMRRLVLKGCLHYIGIARERAWRDGLTLRNIDNRIISAREAENEEKRKAAEIDYKLVVQQIEQGAKAEGKMMLRVSERLFKAAVQVDTVTGVFTNKERQVA
jgi:hypothetical protein